jgi:hypothetical protein
VEKITPGSLSKTLKLTQSLLVVLNKIVYNLDPDNNSKNQDIVVGQKISAFGEILYRIKNFLG